MSYRFSDIVDIPKLQALHDFVFESTGIPTAILAPDGTVLVASGWKRICTEFHRIHPRAAERCTESDTTLAEQVKHNDSYSVYTCLNGLVDVAMPIKIEGEHVATLFTGQFLFEEPDVEFFRAQAQQFGFDEKAYLSALDEVPVITAEQLDRHMHFLSGQASLLAELGLKEKRYRDLVEDANSIILRWRPDGTITFANSFAERFFGYARDALAGRKMIGTIVPRTERSGRDLSALVDDIARHPEKHRAVENENMLRDGRRVWISWTNKALRDSEGTLEEILAIGNDITGRKQNEEHLHLRTEGLEALVNLSEMDAADERAIADFVLKQAIAMTGSEIGFFGFISEDESEMIIHAWSASAMRQCAVTDTPIHYPIDKAGLWGEAVRQRTPLIVNDYAEPSPLKRGLPDGHVALRRVLTVPAIDNNRIVAVLAAGNRKRPYDETDVHQMQLLLDGMWRIVQRRRAEEALRANEEKYHVVADFTYDWETWTGPDRAFMYVSPSCERINGYRAEEFMQNPHLFIDIIHPEDRDTVLGHCCSETPRRENEHIDFRIISRAGETRWISHFCNPIYDRQGRWLGIRGSNRDITERKRVEEQLLQAQKMESIGTLAGGIAHEFNNILGGILGYAQMAQDDASEGGSVRESLSEIEKLCSRARDVVGQILAFSRKSAVNKKPVLPHEIIRDQVKMLRKIIPADIELRTDIDESGGAVLADATQLQQVVMNLCNNALHALQNRGGVLEIAVEPVSLGADAAASLHDVLPGRYVQIRVSDTGPGIDRNILDRIFDPFFTTKEVGKGSGMGLAVAHGIVSGHGGSISVTSEAGQGTCFTVLLPHIEAAGVARAAQEDRRAPGGAERILIVDDEEFIADPMKIMLERLGYRVAARNSGRDALELFRKDPHAFDLVITDLTMPGLTGDRLAAEISALRPDMPVILMTGYNDMIENGRFKESGIAACMAKPCKKHDLAETVRRALDSR